MGLVGWNSDNKIALIIDSSKVDEDLTDFPVLITLSSGSGQTGLDTTDVFDELTTSGVDSNTVLLLHCNGSNGSTSFLDYSGNGHLMTANGNAQISTAQYVFDGSSGHFDDTGDSLTTPASNNWNVGSADFTVDFWTYTTSTPGNDYIFDIGSNGDFFRRVGDRWDFYSDSTYIFQTTKAVSNNEWHHIALVRYSGITKLYIDGFEEDSSSTSYSFGDGANVLTIGNSGVGGAYSLDGYLAEFRISKGIARWTSNFDVPAGPYGCSWGNRKKIAVTTTVSGVETELYVEIERWDDTTSSGNEQAWLWTKVPTLASGVDTDLYLYYDSNHTTNSGYVGDVGESAAQNVWDGNFNAVFHFSEDSYAGDASEIINSTGGTHAHALAGAQPFDALIGNGIEVDDTVKGALTESTINPGNIYTAESFFLKPWGSAGVNALFKSTSPTQYFILMDTDNLLAVHDGSWRKSSYNLSTINDGWHHLSAVSDDTNTYFYVDGEYVASVAYHCTGGVDNFTGFNTQSWGSCDDVRISDVQRSAAWIKATYYTGIDDLITFAGRAELSYYFSGTVYELGSTISGAQIFMYRRDTGEYLGSTTSSGDGGFYVTTSYSGSHFLVCLDLEGGQSYNDLVYGEMYPVTVSG